MSSNNDNIEVKQEIGILIKSLQNAANFNEEEIIEEACGIGTLPYKRQIENMINNISRELGNIVINDRLNKKKIQGSSFTYRYHTSYKNNTFLKMILTKREEHILNFIKDLKLTIYFKEHGTKNYQKSYGTCSYPNYLVDDKLDKVYIYIFSNYQAKQMEGFRQAAYELLYYEISKMYYNYCRLSGIPLNKNYLYDIDDFKSGAIMQNNITENEIKDYCFTKDTICSDFKAKYLMDCCNFLFSTANINMLKEHLYRTVNQQITNEGAVCLIEKFEYYKKENHIKTVKNYLNNTQEYKKYTELREGYNKFFSSISDTEADIIVDFLNNNYVKIPKEGNNANILKKVFKNRIDNMYYNICRIVSISIAEKTDENNEKYMFMFDEVGKIIRKY